MPFAITTSVLEGCQTIKDVYTEEKETWPSWTSAWRSTEWKAKI